VTQAAPTLQRPATFVLEVKNEDENELRHQVKSERGNIIDDMVRVRNLCQPAAVR
jgi:hypothetical protein